MSLGGAVLLESNAVSNTLSVILRRCLLRPGDQCSALPHLCIILLTPRRLVLPIVACGEHFGMSLPGIEPLEADTLPTTLSRPIKCQETAVYHLLPESNIPISISPAKQNHKFLRLGIKIEHLDLRLRHGVGKLLIINRYLIWRFKIKL